MGDGTTTNRTTPTFVAGPVNFASINSGNNHTCAVSALGDAYCWGGKGAGNGGPPSPARVATLSATVNSDLAFTGTLTDPSPADASFEPIFSTTACTYQVTGHHN